jgi:hypothetical protein
VLRGAEPSRTQHTIEQLRSCVARFTNLVFISYKACLYHPREISEEEVQKFGDVCPTLEGCYLCEFSLCAILKCVTHCGCDLSLAGLEEDRWDVGDV